jgi:integrase
VLAAARTPDRMITRWCACSGRSGFGVCEAGEADISDIRYESGYELPYVSGKGAKPARIPLPRPLLRAVREAIDGRATGPIPRTRTGRRMDRAGAARILTRVARAAGVTRLESHSSQRQPGKGARGIAPESIRAALPAAAQEPNATCGHSSVRQLNIWASRDIVALDDLYLRENARDSGVGRDSGSASLGTWLPRTTGRLDTTGKR